MRILRWDFTNVSWSPAKSTATVSSFQPGWASEFINYGIDALRILIPAVRNAVNDEEVNVSSFFWMRFPQAVSLELYDMNAKYLYIVNKP